MAPAKTPKRKRDRNDPGKGRVIALKIAARAFILLLVVGLAIVGKVTFAKAFFMDNPRFQVNDVRVDVLSGTVDPEIIKAELQVKEHQSNLFQVDLAAVRRKVIANAMVQQAEVRRILPGTLWIRVFGRVPVAKLLGGHGRLLDEDGLILPPVVKSETAHLPIITGIADISSYQVGDMLDTELPQAALEFLRVRAIARHGNWLDVKMIQLGHRYRELRVYLRRNDVCLLPDDAVLIIPARDVDGAVDRVLRVLEERARNNQPTSQIDATSLKVITLP